MGEFLLNSGSAASTEGDYDDPTAHYINWLPSGVWQGLFSGYYVGGLDGQGHFGDYWSSTAGSTGGAYTLYFDGGFVDPGNVNPKGNGYAVRCAI